MLTALLNPTATPVERIRAGTFAAAFADGWLADLHARRARLSKAQKKSSPTAAEQFITSNAASGLRLNVDALIAYTYALVNSPTLRKLPFCPFLLNSQECEHRFRILRSMCGIENFTFAELLRRSNLQECHAILKAKHAADFRYEPPRKAWNFDETAHQGSPLPLDFTVTTLYTAAAEGCAQARSLLQECKVNAELFTATAPSSLAEDDHDLHDIDVDDELHAIEWIPDPVRSNF